MVRCVSDKVTGERSKRVVCLMAVFQVLLSGAWATADAAGADLHSLNPVEVLSKLDLDRWGLENVKAAANNGSQEAAFEALLEYYRSRFPQSAPPARPNEANLRVADDVVNHIFQWGPYEPAQYGDDVRWDWDPRGDIEWVAAVYRFYWATQLSAAYNDTRDEKYARAFVELTRDWVRKHPLEEREKTHYVYERWRGFAWLDIQTGIRATQLCASFPTMVHAEAFTPEFLAIFLASLYDHQMKTKYLPMDRVHNKAVFEQRGFVNIAYNFPEFKESREWMELALARLTKNLLAQTTPDGVQREWSGGYHSGVLRDAVEVMGRMEDFGIAVSPEYRGRVRGMFDYIFGIATPELGYPMFGDTSRGVNPPEARSRWQLYSELIEATKLFGDPKYEARALLDWGNLPEQTCYVFRDAGMYALRDTWGPKQIYFAMHCSPPAISGHDQPDNGTFELCAYGRWLMPDTGYYTYGHDADARKWHRRTKVHQTLTLDGEDSEVAGKSLLWHTAPGLAVVAVENESYKGLTHRRTVWFVEDSFFVLLDEAIGNAAGVLDLHFQFAPGEVVFDHANRSAATRFEDANVLVWQGPDAPVTLSEESGWFAWKYGHRETRKAARFMHEKHAPAAFVTVIAPYRGQQAPIVSIKPFAGDAIGADRVELGVEMDGKAYGLGRDLGAQTAWKK